MARGERGAVRRAALLAAAHKVFLSEGFGLASVDDIVRLSGGSSATLYRQFGSKEGLFLAMVEQVIQKNLPDLEHVLEADCHLKRGLQAIGEIYLHSLLHPDWVSLFRIVVGEGRAFPELMRKFNKRGAQLTRGVTRRYLAQRRERGEVRDMDMEAAASFFIEMLRAKHLMKAVSDPEYRPGPDEIREHVAAAVDLICDGFRPRG